MRNLFFASFVAFALGAACGSVTPAFSDAAPGGGGEAGTEEGGHGGFMQQGEGGAAGAAAGASGGEGGAQAGGAGGGQLGGAGASGSAGTGGAGNTGGAGAGGGCARGALVVCKVASSCVSQTHPGAVSFAACPGKPACGVCTYTDTAGCDGSMTGNCWASSADQASCGRWCVTTSCADCP